MRKLPVIFVCMAVLLSACTRNGAKTADSAETGLIMLAGEAQGEPDESDNISSKAGTEIKEGLNRIMSVNAVDGLRVRSTPGLDGERIGFLDLGTKITVTKEERTVVTIGNVEGRWVYTSAPIAGWVFGGDLEYVSGTSTLFSQGFDYGLSQEDLNMVMGQFVDPEYIPGARWFPHDFSWGRQPYIGSQSGMRVIDYDRSFSASFDKEYENHLIYVYDGVHYLIKDIEKISDNIFILLRLDNWGQINDNGEWVPGVNEIQMKMGFYDNRRVMVDNNVDNAQDFADKAEWFAEWWKSAGPDMPVDLTLLEN